MIVLDRFRLNNKIIIVTGAAGLLGLQHALAIGHAGGIPVLLDINQAKLNEASELLRTKSLVFEAFCVDITSENELKNVLLNLLEKYGKVDGLVNNAAANPKVESGNEHFSRLENFSLDQWDFELNIGLKAAMLCSRVFGTQMENQNTGGVIVNVSSDLGIIAPDQRLYRKEGIDEAMQPVKPVTYSVVKHGLIGLSRYLATYWKNVRVNTLVPAGVFNGQPDEFVKKLSNLIPMGRMADREEYQASLVYLLSDASSYMTGKELVVDGGRSVW